MLIGKVQLVLENITLLISLGEPGRFTQKSCVQRIKRHLT
jgi:hypothetical protein